MTTSDPSLAIGAPVHHPRFGLGAVLALASDTAVVRFESGIHECLTSELSRRSSIASPDLAAPGEVVVRAQAEVIHSVNQTWGVFAPSRIQLLPHQLWVCKKVLERWPARWLVADDVGLGKTVEAGLVLWPLLSRGAVKRLLIVCPASLVEQWDQRMRTMFDIRLARYVREADTPTADFWNTQSHVVASLHTLRSVSTEHGRARRQRLLDSEPWDLVLVDEAHHLNVEEQGETQGYKLIAQMQEAGRITSMLFFTATPHRGKNRGFLSLMSLLRPDLFDATRSIESQLPHLRSAMIRNNKQRVTDLHGKPLFQRPTVCVREFAYSASEAAFYEMLTRFIVEGRAYAGKLGAAGQAVGLVLTALQKLAASSVAAIRSALRRRLERLEKEAGSKPTAEVPSSPAPVDDDDAALDQQALWDEQLAALRFTLIEDEIPALRELLDAANAVRQESKLLELMRMLESDLAGRSVLMFTEYKATQALVVSALRESYGDESVTFINGDSELRDVRNARGELTVLRRARADAAAAFNEGSVRFLVSTEAAGEGIDLQESCHTLIHLDVPWNPMRIHQRNGRLYRYGQKHPVDVISLRNPETVESRIWDLLSARMVEIERALHEVMDDPEDLMALVLGMTPPREIERVFEQATTERPERLDRWFEATTASFAGKDVVETVRSIFGNVARFDFQEVAAQVPRVALTDLEPFMRRTLRLLGRKLVADSSGKYALTAPDEFRTIPGVRLRYEGLSFDRYARDTKQVLSGGHKLVHACLDWARARDGVFAAVGGLAAPLVLVRLQDRVTTTTGQVQSVVVGVVLDANTLEPVEVLQDWEVLLRLNDATVPRSPRTIQAPAIDEGKVERSALDAAARLALPFEKPIAAPLVALWPSGAAEPSDEEVS